VGTVGNFGGSILNYKFSFDFDNVPQGSYFMVVLIDTNGNGRLDLRNGEPQEPAGAYPVDSNSYPYKTDFSYSRSNVSIRVSADQEGYGSGFYEDFNNQDDTNWKRASGEWGTAQYDGNDYFHK